MSGNIDNIFKKKIAVVLFNLGGPDSLDAVRPFLFNLFSDPAIIRYPYVIRKIIAFLISTFRYKSAQENYKFMGGKSPLLEETNLQKEALESVLSSKGFRNHKVFISMRYWHPFSKEVLKDIEDFSPDEIILMPLYPHFSTTTTGSSITDFKDNLKNFPKIKDKIVKMVCCYRTDEQFIISHRELIRKKLKEFKFEDFSEGKELAKEYDPKKKVRILFSAHSLPKSIVKAGDPYEWQIRQTVEKIMEDDFLKVWDYRICYQSKVGPVKWLSPSTEEEVEKAGEERKDVLVVPISFVSEHIETLVELDIEYGEIAQKHAINFKRTDTLSTNGYFINSLANMVQKLAVSEDVLIYTEGCCPMEFKKCPCFKKY